MPLLKQIKCWFIKEKNYIDHWFEIDERIRFIAIGIINTLIRYILFVLIGVLISISNYQFTLLLSWMLSSVTAFFAYKILVFKTDGNHLKEYMKCIIVWTISYTINAAFLELLVRQLQLNVYFAQAIAITAIMIINYLLFKHFAFKPSKQLSWWEKIWAVFDN